MKQIWPAIYAVLVMVLGVVMVLLAFTGLAAYSAMEHQCPEGADCADARFAVWMAALLVPALALSLFFLIRALRRR